MLTTVIFDMDDTLYDEIDYCKSGFWAVAKFLSDSPKMPASESIFKALWQQFSTGNHTRTFNAALEEVGVGYDDQLIAELIKVYREHKPNITLPADSKAVLEELRGKYRLAMLTDGFLPAQKLKTQALGIEKYFECIVYTEELGREFWKPSSVGFEKIVKTLNVSPQTMAYIADNEKKDFIGPNQLGLVSIKIIRDQGLHKKNCENNAGKPQYIIHEISELVKLLAKY